MSNTSSYFHGYVIYEDITPLIEQAKILLQKQEEEENVGNSQRERKIELEEKKEEVKFEEVGEQGRQKQEEQKGPGNEKGKQEIKKEGDEEGREEEEKIEEEKLKEERKIKEEEGGRREILDSIHDDENYYVNSPTEIRMKQKKYYYPSMIGVKTSAVHHLSFQCLLEEMYKILYEGKVTKKD